MGVGVPVVADDRSEVLGVGSWLECLRSSVGRPGIPKDRLDVEVEGWSNSLGGAR